MKVEKIVKILNFSPHRCQWFFPVGWQHCVRRACTIEYNSVKWMNGSLCSLLIFNKNTIFCLFLMNKLL